MGEEEKEVEEGKEKVGVDATERMEGGGEDATGRKVEVGEGRRREEERRRRGEEGRRREEEGRRMGG